MVRHWLPTTIAELLRSAAAARSASHCGSSRSGLVTDVVMSDNSTIRSAKFGKIV